MPPQSVEIAETIIAIKRALRREKEAPSEQQISSATNRGNKLKKGAGFVHTGSLPYRYNRHGYKEKVEHAGYQRYILARNPQRYAGNGEALEDSESDEEADAGADEANPYSSVYLDEILRPLTHPTDLYYHPSLSKAYTDPALPDMVRSTEAKLRQERANLWRAKNLHRHFIGDQSWMPCISVEQSDDWDLFEPHTSEPRSSSPGRKRKRDDENVMMSNGTEHEDRAEILESNTNTKASVLSTNGVDHEVGMKQPDLLLGEDSPAQGEQHLTDFSVKQDQLSGENKDPSSNSVDKSTTDQKHDVEMEGQDDEVLQNGENGVPLENGDQPKPDEEMDDAVSTTPPIPTRRITRALAATNTSNSAVPSVLSTPVSSALSFEDDDPTLYDPHSLFLLPISLATAQSTHISNLPLHVAHSGLPIDEIVETRRLLGLFIQKQEETIRGLEGLLGKLIKAKRMRDQVWGWCKAEIHVGEWSDGEDWVDCQSWGIDESELRKGKDEDNIEEEPDPGARKGKRRRGAGAKEKDKEKEKDRDKDREKD